MKKYFVFFLLLGIYFTQINCNSKSNSESDIFADLTQKTIIFPDSIRFSIYACQDVDYNIKSGKLKILLYADSIGCINCKLKLFYWKPFMSEIRNIVPDNDSITFCFIFQPKTMGQIERMLKENGFSYPVCIDHTNEFDSLNHLPKDDRFHCFLLDSTNRVILIGNPTQNPKIKDLYIRTICERLNINYSPKAENTLHKNLGVFSQSETKTVQFEIKNPDKKILKIDSVFTSCECTKAKIDKTEILQNESAVLTVTYKPDGIGDFVREIYVKIHDEEKPEIFEIEGK